MEKYEPLADKGMKLPAKVHFLSLTDNGDGFNVTVSAQDSRDHIICIKFETVLAYRSIDEGDRLKLWENFIFSRKTFIYKVLDSEFMRYFHEESYNIHSEENLGHFFLVTTDSCIDIISESCPSIIVAPKE